MKKTIKWCAIILAAVVGIYALYIVEECIRLSSVSRPKPLIVLSQTGGNPEDAKPGKEVKIEYTGLGYKFAVRYYRYPETRETSEELAITAEEFVLFDKLLLWAFVV